MPAAEYGVPFNMLVTSRFGAVRPNSEYNFVTAAFSLPRTVF